MPVLQAQKISKRFLLRHNASVELKVRFLSLLDRSRRETAEEFWALKGISLEIEHGEAVGLVGRNGSGKSTFLKVVAAIHRPTQGRLLVARDARISSMIELGVGFHPELTGRENVFLNAAIQGLSRAAIEEKYDAIVDYSGLGHFIDVPIKNYSSGMYMRLGFAIAANMSPDILLLDEIFAVGDADFQQQCIATVKRFLEEGKTMIFVSHAPDAIRAFCRRVCVLEQGQLAFDGGLEEGLAFYQHLHGQRTIDGSSLPATVEADPNSAPHRLSAGSHWEEAGAWQLEFLRREGLERGDYVLDVGCGSLAGAIHLLPFLDEHHYWGIDRDAALVDAGVRIELPRAGIAPDRGRFLVNGAFELDEIPPIDVAIASSLFSSLPFNSVARCIAGVVRKLRPKGRFYATLFENPDPGSFEPIVHPNGVTTYPDREPYHYPFELIEQVSRAVDATADRVADSTNPRGESVIVISRRSEEN
ncbi:MAG TPA: ATP-binding cassette domain-containing protein [Vicinamibacterales bacterium]|nr:ATP-binding cassette domain-containing protein [Vicinamibacterales bacterium]